MTDMTALDVAGFWSGLLLFVLIALSVNVVVSRNRHRVLLGDGGVEPMNVAVRAFGKGPPPARVVGMTLTWLPLLAAAGLLVARPLLP